MSSFDPLGISAPTTDSSAPERDINGNPMPPKTSATVASASPPAEVAPTRDARPSWERAAPRPPVAAPRPAGGAVPPPESNGFRAVPAPQPVARPLPPSAPPRPAPSFAPSGETVKYDLAGNPLPLNGPAGAQGGGVAAPAAPYPPASGVRYDLSGNPLPAMPAPAAGAWPPSPTGGFAAAQMQNSSGKQEDVPPEIARLHWNWGAFLFPRLWCYWHGMSTVASMMWGALVFLRVINNMHVMYAGVLSGLYGIAEFGFSIYLGLNGHKIGWRNRRFPSIDEFFKVQRAWMIAGLLLQVVVIGFWAFVISVVLSLAGSGALSGHHGYTSPSGSGYNQPLGSPSDSGGAVPAPDASTPGAGTGGSGAP